MNWRLLPGRFLQVISLEFRSWMTPGCGPAYAIRKWRAVILNLRKIKFLEEYLYYEDRLSPFTIFTYVGEVRDALDKCIPKGTPLRVLEVGANVGIWGRALYGQRPETMLYSFEPNPEPFALLEKNSKTIPLWKVFNSGIGQENKSMEFYYVPGKSGQGSFFRVNSSLNLVGGGEPVKSLVHVQPLTPEFLFSKCDGVHFDLVKIDVEGAERYVIEGLKSITWDCMYVELSLDRAGADSLESFIELLRKYWPSARIIDFQDHGVCADVYFGASENRVGEIKL